MDVQRSQQLKEIVSLSREMLRQAGDNEWERVGELEQTRRELVMTCFGQRTPEQDGPEVAAAIKEILRLNQELTELGKRQREALGAEVHNHKLGSAAQAAYLNCGR
jgi:hypothetical protein